MNVDQLVATIAALPPARVAMAPDLLAEHLPVVVLDAVRLHAKLDAVGARAASEPAGVVIARIWLGLLSLTADAFWVRDERAARRSAPAPLALSTFGRQFLAVLSLRIAGHDDSVTAAQPPTRADLERLAESLTRQSANPDLPDQALPTLARVVHAALSLALALDPALALDLAATADQLAYRLASDPTASDGRASDTALAPARQLWQIAARAYAARPLERARCQMNEANILVALPVRAGEPDHLREAERLLREALPAAAGDASLQAACRSELAAVLLEVYQRRQSPELIDEVVQLLRDALAQLPQGSDERRLCLIRLGQARLLRYRAMQAREDLAEVLALFQEARAGITAGPLAAMCDEGIAQVLQHRAAAATEGPDFDGAVAVLRRLVDEAPSRESQVRARRRVNLANALVRRYLERGAGDWLAIANLEEALGLYADAETSLAPHPLDGALCRLSWGRALLIARPLRTGPVAQQELRQVHRLLDDAASIFEAHDVAGPLQEALTNLGIAHRLAGDLDQAFDTLARAVLVLESALLAMPDAQLQQTATAAWPNVYEELVAIALSLAEAATDPHERLRRWRDAWSYAERGKARLTVQRWQAAAADATVAAGNSSKLLPLLRALARCRGERATLAGQWTSFREERTPAGPEQSTSDRLRMLAEEEERILADLAREHASVARLYRIEPPDLLAVQAALRGIADGALLVELISLPGELVVFLLDGSALRVWRVAVTRAELHERSSALIDTPRDADGIVRIRYQVDALPASLDWLADQLTPMLSDLSATLRRLGLRNGDHDAHVPHVMLVPSGALHLWSLTALPLQGENGARLLDVAACAVLPAAGILPDLAGRQPEPGTHVAFAPDAGLDFAAPQAWYEARVLDGHAVVGPAASFAELCRARGSSVTLATHAAVDLLHPERSTVLLAGLDGGIEPVTALEFALGVGELRCTLINLLACQTHGAGVRAGDAWGGVSEAFLQAARTLIASLWPVGDLTTLLLVVPLCDGLCAGLTVPQALRAAQRALRDADADTITRWRARLAAALPASAGARFDEAWQRWTDGPLSIRGLEGVRRTQLDPAPFHHPGWWAPYVAIGYPGAL